MWILPSSSLTAAIPPDVVTSVVSTLGETLTLACPLQFIINFGQFYMAEWRVQNGITVARTKPPELTSWARVNNQTLELTVGPLNSSMNVFECVILQFQRMTKVEFGTTSKGTVSIILACKSSPCGINRLKSHS